MFFCINRFILITLTQLSLYFILLLTPLAIGIAAIAAGHLHPGSEFNVPNVILRILQDIGVGLFTLGIMQTILNIFGVKFWLRITTVLVIYALVTGLQLFDLAVFYYSGFRMEYDFIRFLGTPKMFIALSDNYNLVPAFTVTGGFILTVIYLGIIFGKLKSWQFSRRQTGACVFSGFALGVATLPFFHPSAFYAFSNAGVKLSGEWMQDVIATRFYGNSRSEKINKYLKPQNESARYFNPDYPLYKTIEKFSGEPAFDINITPENEPRHVIILFLESFRGVNVGALNRAGKDLTPHFNQLAKEGVLFSNCYSNGVHTEAGAAATLYGELAAFTVRPADPARRLWGLPEFFRDKGYLTAYFSGSPRDLCSAGNFFPQHGYQSLYFQEEIKKITGLTTNHPLGFQDHITYNVLMNWLKKADQANLKTFSTTFSITNHIPFQLTEDPLPETLQAKDLLIRYVDTMHYTDATVNRLINALKENGLYEKSLIVLLADHGYPLFDRSSNLSDFSLNEECVLIPMLILAPGRLTPKVITDPCSQIDLLPTMLDIFNASPVSCSSLGRSMRRKPETPTTAYFSFPFQGMMAGMRKGQYKYIYYDNIQKSLLYDLNNDPMEKKNIAPQYPKMVEDFKNEVLSVNQANTYLIRKKMMIPEK